MSSWAQIAHDGALESSWEGLSNDASFGSWVQDGRKFHHGALRSSRCTPDHTTCDNHGLRSSAMHRLKALLMSFPTHHRLLSYIPIPSSYEKSFELDEAKDIQIHTKHRQINVAEETLWKEKSSWIIAKGGYHQNHLLSWWWRLGSNLSLGFDLA